ncbi:hypothetical protein [Mucilaginibacter sp.]|jgi:hypothetical protein|uniref:hypothetical protein n=1 Tax=Mucilaginibacter sp. TaxID=1882438 RepID=UPI0025CBCA37|nr:hypothetical protein [Mucilaginibacter sp.]
MKKSLFPVLVLALLVACKSSTKQSTKDSTTTPLEVAPKIDIENIKSKIQGTWVKKAYIDKVIETKSPLAAVDEASDLTTFVINTDDIKGDSLKVLAGWGNHDGSELTLKFKAGKQPSSIIFGAGELGLSSVNGANILTYYRLDEKSKKTIATQYIKALSQKPNELGEGTYYLVNKGLIAGDYTMTDSLGVISKINFDPHGKVSSFLGYKTYNINIDLNSDVMDNLDEIGFDSFSKDPKSYSFKIDADTLKLYDTRPNADSTELVLDKLKYRLVRVR